MANTLKTIIQLRRLTLTQWEALGATYKPFKGEVCLVDTTDKGLRIKIGDGTTLFSSLPYADDELYKSISNVVVQGYFNGTDFYTDSSYTELIPRTVNTIYIDKNSTNTTDRIYTYDATTGVLKYKSIKETLPDATSTSKGVMKLYADKGDNTDGTITQKGIKDGVSKIVFSVDSTDTECLVLGSW